MEPNKLAVELDILVGYVDVWRSCAKMLGCTTSMGKFTSE